MENRESLLHKIRSLLAKTMENGCTEAEALAALARARAMMDAYEVTDEELQLSKEEKAILRPTPGDTGRLSIRNWLSVAVSNFTDTKCYRDRNGSIVFVGLKSDVDFASWLIDTLSNFVRAELTEHLISSPPTGGRSDTIRTKNGFVMGCTKRISERLNELVAQSRRASPAGPSNGRALVVVKSQAVDAALKDANVTIGRARPGKRRIDRAAYAAGRAAGDRASFGRPVGGGASLRLS